MKVIVDSGPLMALGKINALNLLHKIYGQTRIPSAVYDEVVTRGLETGQQDAYTVQLAVRRNEIIIVEISDQELDERVRDLPLGRGERHVIHLGLKEIADLVLMDDALAREKSENLGLKVKGTLGAIVDAFKKKVLSLEEVELIFQSLRERDDIWISDKLIQRVLDDLRKQGQ